MIMTGDATRNPDRLRDLRPRRAFLASAVASLALVLTAGTGCTPPAGSPSASSGDGGATTSGVGVGKTASAGPVQVRLAFFPNVTHAAALVGTGDGTFKKALGQEATLEERTFTAGPAEIEALFAGEVDLGYIGPGPAVNGYLKSKGEALKIIAGASSGGAALVRRGDVDIKSVADLAGKRVAVPQTGGTQDISLRHFLQEAKLQSKEKGGTVDVVQFAPADTLNLFNLKQIDAAWVPEPWVSRLVKETGGVLVTDERTLWPGGTFATTVVVARTAFLKEHPDVVRRFLAAHVAAVDRVSADPVNSRKVIAERIKKLTGKGIGDDLLQTALSRTAFTADPMKDTVLTLADWSRALGYQREGRDALTGLFDTALLDEALAAGKKPGSQAAITKAVATGKAK